MADAHAKRHDYHLVDPSPWPFIGALSALTLAVGFVTMVKSMEIGGLRLGPYIFGAGAIGVLYTMLSWWVDVVREAEHQGHHTRVVQIHHRYGMIMFIASEVMFFVAWFWAYFEAALYPADPIQFQRTELTGGTWPPRGIEAFDPWHLPLFGTLVLLTSGTTITWAHHALLHGDRQSVKWGLWLTVILGALFTVLQVYEYSHAAFGFSGNIYGATFYMATGFHGAHVVIGTIFLAICLYRVYLGHFTTTHHLGFEFAAWYWHFVDVVWLFLFAAIYVYSGIGSTGAH
jgi:cytochrome c oxidase subunit 3